MNAINDVQQTGATIYALDAVGTDSYAITLSPPLKAYANGNMINFKAGTANTGAATLNVNGLGAIPIKKEHDQALATGDIEAGQIVTVIYDGINFQMQSQLAQSPVNPFAVLQDGSPLYGADSVGTDSYAITLSPAPLAYTTGMVLNFMAGTSNTGAATLDVNTLGAKTIVKQHDQTLVTGDIEVGQIVTVVYDGTNFQMQSQTAQGANNLLGTTNQIDVTAPGASQTASISSTFVAPGTVTLNADPVTALQAATKQYVDAVAALGLDFKAAVVCATTTALTVTYSNGVAGVGATLTNATTQAAFSTDGITPSVGSRVLVKNQVSTFQNGIYTVTNAGSGATNWILTRTSDFDTAAEIVPGAFVAVETGTTLALTSFIQTATVVTVGTDPIVFSQFTYGTTFPSLAVTGNITNSALTASRAVVTDGSKVFTSSATTSTELGYVNGVTSAIQTQLDAKIGQPGAQIYGLDAVGTDTYAITLSPAPSGYTTGMIVNFKAGTANTGAATLNVNGLGAVAIKKLFNQALNDNDIKAGQVVTLAYDGTNFQMQSQIANNSVVPSTSILVQRVSTETGAVASGATAFPIDDTIPQNTEGDEYMTLAITPLNTNNKLVITVTIMGSESSAASYAGFYSALFQDSTANALAAMGASNYTSVNNPCCMTYSHIMTAGTTSSTTFKVRAGVPTGTFVFNGVSGPTRQMGGVMACSIQISEYTA